MTQLPRKRQTIGWFAAAACCLVGTARAGVEIRRSGEFVEESLVWRTRVEPKAPSDWRPTGVAFGAAKPTGFSIEDDCGWPFKSRGPIPPVSLGAGSAYTTADQIVYRGRPDDPDQWSEAPQFGTKVVSTRPGLALTRPTLLLEPRFPMARPIESPAWMPDNVEFRIERGDGDMLVFSLRNGDPKHAVAFHNLRFSIDPQRVTPLTEPILIDRTLPFAHSFAHEAQAETPPVVRPKEGFRTFQACFPEAATPLIVASGHESSEFVLGEAKDDAWVYVEGFATRSDLKGRPILNEKGLPEEPSEFRYGARLARRRGFRLDLTAHPTLAESSFDALGAAPATLPPTVGYGMPGSPNPFLSPSIASPSRSALSGGAAPSGPAVSTIDRIPPTITPPTPIWTPTNPVDPTIPPITPPAGSSTPPNPGGGNFVTPSAAVPEPSTTAGAALGLLVAVLTAALKRGPRSSVGLK